MSLNRVRTSDGSISSILPKWTSSDTKESTSGHTYFWLTNDQSIQTKMISHQDVQINFGP